VITRSRANSVRPKTIQGYRTDLRYVEASAAGKVRLTKLTPEDIEGLYAAVLARPGCSPGTVAHLKRTLSAAHSRRPRSPRPQPGGSRRDTSHTPDEVEPLDVDR
jgi:hypothetical protein